MSVKYIEGFYNFYSGVYDQIFGKLSGNGLKVVPRLLDLKPGEKLLEVGIGTGLSLANLPKEVDVTGVDVSEKMLSHARSRVEEVGHEHVHLYRMDANQLAFSDNSFDSVLAAYFISTVPEPVRAIQEIKRVCKPGGYILFLNHFRSENPVMGVLDKVFSPLCFRLGFRSDLELDELMETAGLEIEHLEPIALNGYWKAVRCITPGATQGRRQAKQGPKKASRSQKSTANKSSQSSSVQKGAAKSTKTASKKSSAKKAVAKKSLKQATASRQGSKKASKTPKKATKKKTS